MTSPRNGNGGIFLSRGVVWLVGVLMGLITVLSTLVVVPWAREISQTTREMLTDTAVIKHRLDRVEKRLERIVVGGEW